MYYPGTLYFISLFWKVVAVTDYACGELFQILEDDGSLPEEQVRLAEPPSLSGLFVLHDMWQANHKVFHVS